MRLIARDVWHRYHAGDDWILRGVSIAIGEDANSVALMGPSGSGKTTLLSVLGGLLTPSQGSVEIEGAEGEVLDSVSWVHQAAHVIGPRSVLDNVAIGFLAHGANRRLVREDCFALLELVGLGHRVEVSAKTLSGGEMQRLGIARALAKGDPFILADEPTGQLDRLTSEKVLDALFAGAGQGVSIVVATHDASVADRCNQVFEVNEGIITNRVDQ